MRSHTSSTQSEAGVSQGLRGVREAAKERKQERFTALLHHLSVDLLRESSYVLKRQAAPGVDGVSWQGYDTGLEDRLIDLHSQPSRRVYIPKADGRQRPLGIASLEDKIVQQAVVTILKCDLRGGLQGILVRVSTWAQPAPSARRAECGHLPEARELDSGCRHSRVLRQPEPRMDGEVCPASRSRPAPSSFDP